MSDELTLKLNRKEYELSEEFKQTIEERAAGEFEENDFFECWWTENDRGDPILNIETEGYWVPWSKLERLEFEMQEVEQPQQQDDSGDEKTDLDGGGGLKSVPKDDVDMDTDDPTEPSEEEQEDPDTSFMMTHPSKHYVPQPEQDDPEKVPPDPEELPEDPSLVAWIPENGMNECWTTGKALVPQELFLEWNVQLKADDAPDGATKTVVGDDGSTKEVPRYDSHDRWENIAEMTDCEVVAEEQPSDTPPSGDSQPSGYSGKEPDESLDGAYGGNNWNV